MGKISFIDLFAGCGGLSEGFMSTGKFEGIAHVEWEIPMINTLRNRLVKKWNHTVEDAQKNVVHFDIQKTDELFCGKWTEETVSLYGKTNNQQIISGGLDSIIGNNKIDLIIGGPPCQAYSLAGRAQDKNSMKDDYRNYLFESFVKTVDHYQPEIFVFENVPGILSAKPGGELVTERIFKAFSEIGYEIRKPELLKKSLYFASEFGVPQKRNRIIIVGVRAKSKHNLESVYDFIDEEKVQYTATVKDAIGDLPKFIPMKNPLSKGQSHQEESKDQVQVLNHTPRFHNERDVRIFKDWVSNNLNNIPMQDRIAYYNNLMNKSSNHAKYRSLEWDKPSPTVVAHLYKDGLMFIHPDSKQARSITVREAARLQSFPDDFEFVSSMGNSFKMIGNAVPVKMAEKIAEGVYKYLKSKV